MCVHLAGSYQGLALPDDRYKEGAERGSKKKYRAGFFYTPKQTHRYGHTIIVS